MGYLYVALAVPSTIVALVLSLHFWATYSEENARSFSEGPMGLRRTAAGNRPGGRMPFRHAILDVRPFGSAEEWAQALKSRGCRRTMGRGGQIDKSWAAKGIGVHTVAPTGLGFAHFRVIVAHERRSYALWQAVLAATMRFFVARSMTGVIDEYRADGGSGELLGWAHAVVKGATLRGMWFYQARGDAFIWHGGIRHAVERGTAMPNVHHVDLGPSKGANVVAAKERFGFADVEDWPDICDYAGEFVPPRPLAGLGGVKEE